MLRHDVYYDYVPHQSVTITHITRAYILQRESEKGNRTVTQKREGVTSTQEIERRGMHIQIDAIYGVPL